MRESEFSIHFAPVKEGSERHNLRTTKEEVRNVKPEIKGNHESEFYITNRQAKKDAFAYRRKIVEREGKGRGLRKDANIIQEAVLNIKSTTTMDDLKKYGAALEENFGIEITQYHIHRDEGHYLKDEKGESTGVLKVNHHAHILAKWQDKKTGKKLRLKPIEMAQMQTIGAEVLEMVRGREGGTAERLEHIDYKLKKKKENLQELELQIKQEQQSHKEQKELKSYTFEQEISSIKNPLQNEEQRLNNEERKYAQDVNSWKQVKELLMRDMGRGLLQTTQEKWKEEIRQLSLEEVREQARKTSEETQERLGINRSRENRNDSQEQGYER